jgi:hypothetical protein
VDVVFEAVPERLELKQDVFAKFEQHVGDSSLDVYNAVGSYLNKDLSTSGEDSSTIRERIAGIYDYTPEQIQQLGAQRAAKLVAVRRVLEG